LDTPALLWALLGFVVLFLALVGEDRRPVSWRRTVAAGVLFGLALLTKEKIVFVTLLPLGICFVLGWALPRIRSALIGVIALITYAPYPAIVYAMGDWQTFLDQKFAGVSRIMGLVQITGFNQQDGPSFLAAIFYRLDEFATTYVLIATGALAVCVLLLTGLGKAPDKRLLVSWTASAYAFLAYAMVFGTLEEHFFYYLVVPSILATTVTATLMFQKTRVGAALRAPEGRRTWLALRAAAVASVGALTLWSAYVWVVVHTVPDNAYQRVVSYVDELPKDSRVAVTSTMAEPLISRHAGDGRYQSVEALREDDIDYVVISSYLANRGWGQPSAEVYRWVRERGRLVYGFEGSSSGLLGVWNLQDPTESLASGRVKDVPPTDTADPTGPTNAEDSSPDKDGRCAGEDRVCIRERVSEVAPEAEYLGGRIDVEAGGPSPNRSVLYFEDPTLDPCEYKTMEQVPYDSSTSYVAIVAGKGSYGGENGRNCVPEPGR
jgi:hypothetical protein